jgi:hypothetical protein
VGEGKIRLVARNQQQMTLFPEIHDPQEVNQDSEDLSRLQTWFLISNRRLFGDHVTISSELSLPSETGETRYITRYVYLYQSFVSMASSRTQMRMMTAEKANTRCRSTRSRRVMFYRKVEGPIVYRVPLDSCTEAPRADPRGGC